jgi:hypothetical protein
MSHARFHLNPPDLRASGQQIIDINQARLSRGYNLDDRPAMPLHLPKSGRGGYPGQKERRGDQPIRDWYFTGRTRNSMAILSMTDTAVTVGFSDPEGARRAAINNAREKQFGLSRSDHEALRTEVHKARPIEVKVSR